MSEAWMTETTRRADGAHEARDWDMYGDSFDLDPDVIYNERNEPIIGATLDTIYLNGQPMPTTEYALARWAIANERKVKEYNEIAETLAAVDIGGEWAGMSPLYQVKALIELYGGNNDRRGD
jgi:hypothetical protein